MEHKSISDFEDEVMFNVLLGNATLKVTDENGDTPVVACLDDEPLSELLKRVSASGGNATVFSRAANGAVRVLGAVQSECALAEQPTDMVTDPPSDESPIGMFLDYVAQQEDGVVLPSSLSSQIRSYGQTELTHV